MSVVALKPMTLNGTQVEVGQPIKGWSALPPVKKRALLRTRFVTVVPRKEKHDG